MGASNLHFLRRRKGRTITLLNFTATTTISSTTEHYGTAQNVSGYNNAAFIVNVILNSTGAPAVSLQGSFDNSNWFDFQPLDADITTTANSTGKVIGALPPYIRTKMTPLTTTIDHFAVTVKAQVKA